MYKRQGIDFNQNAVAERHRAQQPPADEKREACPQRPGIRQKTGSGKDEAAPADDGPYGQCPDFGRAHGFFEFLAIRLRFRRVIHISISFQFEGGKSGPGAHMIRITHGFVRPLGRNARTAECVRLQRDGDGRRREGQGKHTPDFGKPGQEVGKGNEGGALKER